MSADADASAPAAPWRVLRVVIEGNIGSGKSTQADAIPRFFQEGTVESFPEPVECCTNFPGTGENLLELSYKHPQQHAQDMQLSMIMARGLKQWDWSGLRPSNAAVHILERGIWSDRFVFAAHAVDKSWMDWDAYMRVWKFYAAMQTMRPDIAIFIDTPPEECYRRKKLDADRGGEKCGITLELLEDLHARHARLADEYRAMGIPIYHVPGAQPLAEVSRSVVTYIVEESAKPRAVPVQC